MRLRQLQAECSRDLLAELSAALRERLHHSFLSFFSGQLQVLTEVVNKVCLLLALQHLRVEVGCLFEVGIRMPVLDSLNKACDSVADELGRRINAALLQR